LGWGTATGDTIRVARLAVETGLFPVFEAEAGEITGRLLIRERMPVDEYLIVQKRFAHLFSPRRDERRIAMIQSIADRNVGRFGLVEQGAQT
jgi:pyruvate ferredoxin oxidoreductase beta subunit